jgi:hypothetical protein
VKTDAPINILVHVGKNLYLKIVAFKNIQNNLQSPLNNVAFVARSQKTCQHISQCVKVSDVLFHLWPRLISVETRALKCFFSLSRGVLFTQLRGQNGHAAGAMNGAIYSLRCAVRKQEARDGNAARRARAASLDLTLSFLSRARRALGCSAERAPRRVPSRVQQRVRRRVCTLAGVTCSRERNTLCAQTKHIERAHQAHERYNCDGMPLKSKPAQFPCISIFISWWF